MRRAPALAALLLATCWAAPAVAAAELRPVDCWVAANSFQNVDCYRILLPLDRAHPEAGTVDLPVAVLRASTDTPEPDPVLYMEGGPGGPAFSEDYPGPTDYSAFWWGHTTPFRRTRDFILFDQRGIGLARPSLDCEELHELDRQASPSPDFDDPVYDAELVALAACHDRLVAAGVDLAFFDTRNSADDVADIVAALGYDKVNLYGASYGTRLALEVMRRHPGIVRAAVLDGVYPPDIDFELDFPGTVAGAIGNLLADCADLPACARLAPDAADRLAAFAIDLDRAPRRLELYDDYYWSPGTRVLLDGQSVLSSMIDALYDSEALTYIPLVVGTAERGDLDALSYFYGTQTFASQGLTEGSLVNVECRESKTLDSAQLDQVARPYGIWGEVAESWSLIPYCAVWPVPRAPLAADGPVVSDIPTLLMSGRYDPVTPVAYAERAAATLSNNAQLVFQAGGHAVSFAFRCGRDTAAAFFENPDPATLAAPRCRDYSEPAHFAMSF